MMHDGPQTSPQKERPGGEHEVRSAIKDARASQGAEKRTSVSAAIRELDRAVSKGVIHRNTAARKKSALARRLVAAR
jgi:small subunit ribosomal protein S20